MKQSKPDLLKRMRRGLFLLGFLKIPMLGRLRPKIEILNEEKAQVRIKLRRRSKNHLGSMYFAALAAGADCCAGLHAFYFTQVYHRKMSFLFKSMEAQFLKRADTDTIFVFNDGKKIENLVKKSMKTGERYHLKCPVHALNTHKEPVAEFIMEVSIKVL